MVMRYDNMSEKSAKETMISKCCCCIPLRVGCFILGYFTLFLNLIQTFTVVSATIYFGLQTKGFSTMEAFTPATDEDGHVLSTPYTPHKEMEPSLRIDEAVVVHVVGWILAVVIICDLIWLAINIACLVGLHKKNPGPVRTYVVFATVRLIITTTSHLYRMNTADDQYAFHAFALCIGVGLNAYFILVYYIYAMKLRSDIHQKEIEKAPESQVNDIGHIYPTKLDKQYLVVYE